MFERLQTKWKVNGTQLFLVLCVFALGGSATGWLGKVVMTLFPVNQGWLWTLVYIVVVTLIWPIAVLLVSIPFGQFTFFARYLARIGRRMKVLKRPPTQIANSAYKTSDPRIATRISEDKNESIVFTTPVNIAIFASGTGSNASKIIEYFNHRHDKPVASVKLVVCNKPGAGVLEVARRNGVPSLLIEKAKFFEGSAYIDELKAAKIDFIVLAGFLWKIPQKLIDHYRNKIVNIHPALLPKYGGRGMYGSRVHEAVINAGERESGITIHYVDEQYDNGDIIFQERVPVAHNETPASLASKIHHLEYTHYPMIIEQLILEPNGR